MTVDNVPRQSASAAADHIDLRFAARELAEAHRMLVAAHEIIERGDRREAIKVAIARLTLASRAIDEVVDRRTITTAR